jgi:hypothetical protein
MAEERVEHEEDLVREPGAAETGVDVGVRSISVMAETASFFIGVFAGIGGAIRVTGVYGEINDC